MEEVNKLGKLLKSTSLNAFIGWTMVSFLFLMAITNLVHGRLTWSILSVFVIIITIPALLLRKPSVMPSWYFIAIAIMPIIGGTTAYYFFSEGIPAYFSVATIALLLTAEVDRFTSVHMNYKFAIVLVVITTLAVSGIWNLLRWTTDVTLGTTFLLDDRSYEAINTAVMYEFICATIAGIAAGILFGWYFRSIRSAERIELLSHEASKASDHRKPGSSRPRRKFLGLSDRKQKFAIRTMQIGLFVLLVAGIILKDMSTTLNASTGLMITFVPYFITRKFDIPHDTGLALWITLAIFLHSIGTFAFYDYITRWDNVTHALSAGIIATAGYTLIRAIDIYTDEIYIPPKVLFLFILLFVLATGVLWEIFEFLSGELSSGLGHEDVLVQHGINDTMADLLFNLLGAILAATWATAYLSDISYRLADKFEEMNIRR